MGDAHKIQLPDVGRLRGGPSRLRGLRLVHTHLKPDGLDKDDLTDLALLRLDVVAVIEALEDGLPGKIEFAHLLPENPDGQLWRIEGAPSVHALDWHFGEEIRALEEQLTASVTKTVAEGEQAILVGVSVGGNRSTAETSLRELEELADTAGVHVLDTMLQSRREYDPKFLVGRGKLEEIVLKSMQLGADILVFDRNLSPSQARHIAEATSLKVLDRTQLILDIFAQRAQSAEGKLQVELAQLRYLMPRLTKQADAGLSRLMGGIGGRGPGETKLEVDRRRIRDRVRFLERKIDGLSASRATRRKERVRRGLPVISIVGYTNAGKSTLLNALTQSEVFAEDKLFATLDPTSRRLRFPRDREVIITDTVGFIRDLPKDLVAAFRATLEELESADLLLHVVDVTDPEREAQIEAVEKILDELELLQTPRILVFNKADKLASEDGDGGANLHGAVLVSSTERTGFDQLLRRADKILWAEGLSNARHTLSTPA